MNINFTTEFHNEELIIIEDFYLEIANKGLNLLAMPSPNRSAVASFNVELRREQNYYADDVLGTYNPTFLS